MSITPTATAPVDKAGLTRLACGTRVEKDSPTIELMGAIEELSAWIAMLAADPPSDAAGRVLAVVGNDLHELLQQVAASGTVLLSAAYVRRLDGLTGEMEGHLPPRHGAHLPGGAPGAAAAAVARSVCRRAERRLVSYGALAHIGVKADEATAYLDRLADALEQIGRLANQAAGLSPRRFDHGLSLAGPPAPECAREG